MRDVACSFAGIVSSGCASNCNSSEMAVPIRARPKSRAKIRFITVTSLQFRRNFADEVFDSFRFVFVTDQQGIWCSHDDEIMDSEQRYGCAVFLENDVVAGIERGDAAVRSVSLLILLKVIRYASPTPDIVP